MLKLNTMGGNSQRIFVSIHFRKLGELYDLKTRPTVNLQNPIEKPRLLQGMWYHGSQIWGMWYRGVWGKRSHVGVYLKAMRGTWHGHIISSGRGRGADHPGRQRGRRTDGGRRKGMWWAFWQKNQPQHNEKPREKEGSELADNAPSLVKYQRTSSWQMVRGMQIICWHLRKAHHWVKNTH